MANFLLLHNFLRYIVEQLDPRVIMTSRNSSFCQVSDLITVVLFSDNMK